MSAQQTSTDEQTADTPYTWGRLSADLVQEWAALTNVLAVADGTGEFYQEEDLAEELAESGCDPEQDTWGVWHDGRLVAFGQLRVPPTTDHEGRARSFLGGGVHPDHRGRGLGRDLVSRMEQRALTLLEERHNGVPAYWRAEGGLPGAGVRDLFTHRGYRIARYFHEMSRPVPGAPLPSTEVEATLVSPTDEHEERTRLAHNVAFRDHWGSGEMTAEVWHDHWIARGSRLALSSLALDPDGAVLAYVLVGEWVAREAYVTTVGTVPEARGRGLAAACLSRTVALCEDAGAYDKVDLHVDSVSPTGATRLYERVGFAVAKTFAAMQKDIDPSAAIG